CSLKIVQMKLYSLVIGLILFTSYSRAQAPVVNKAKASTTPHIVLASNNPRVHPLVRKVNSQKKKTSHVQKTSVLKDKIH
ncbi:MAG TPA: hypothetical protein PKL85_04805, partial [Bacteroidia bacterium]|nr:hypothetical protein [Bacteroidia bacterium]